MNGGGPYQRTEVYKVVIRFGTAETVYLVSAKSSRDAEWEVLGLYDKEDRRGCSINAQPFEATTPYMLYTFDTKTGDVS